MKEIQMKMMRIRIPLLVIALLLTTLGVAQANWQLTFSDEFNGSSLNTGVWSTTYPGGGRAAGGNGEQEYYTDNAFTFPTSGTSGYLQINTSQKTQSYSQCLNGTCQYTSGLITTYGTFSQTYGYFEMRAKVPAGQGLWPAFWLLPYPVNYSNEPYEMDIFEIGYGGGSTINPFLQGTFHYSNYAGQDYFNNNNNYSTGWHTYAIDWEPGSLTWYIDGTQVYQTTTNVPSSPPAFVLANMAIGGSWGAIGYPTSTSASAIGSNSVPMQIDYIRVYQKTNTGGYTSIPGATPIPTIGGSTTDTTAPTVSISSPTANASVSGTVSVSANATDNVGVTKVEFYVNGALKATDTAGPYLYSWSTTGLASGSYTLMAKAYDAAGNVGTSSNVTVNVVTDTTPPTATMTSPAAGATLSGTATISASASDNIGVVKVEFYANGTLLAASNVAPYNYSWNTTAVANGSYTLTAKAYDNAGNVGTSSGVTVNVSNSTTTASTGSTGSTTGTGLVAAYSFDEGTGTTVTDKSGNGNNGTISNATWTTGKYGNALSFNGTSSMVTIPNAASLNLTNGMTLEAWVKPSKVSGIWQDVIYKGSDNYYLEATSPTSSLPVGASKVNGTVAGSYAASALAANSWTHLAVTYDGSAVRMYVNGSQVSSKAQSGSMSSTTYPLQIGGDSIYGEYFSGVIDEVRVYNVALSQSQIQTDMNTALSTSTTSVTGSTTGSTTGTTTGTTGLVAAYAFNEGTGTTVTDKSGNGNNGTISNATWTTGKYGSALSFNGASSMVTIPNSASLNLSTGMTLEAWVNPSKISAIWQDVIYKGNDNYYLEATSPTGSYPVGASTISGAAARSYGTSALTANSWAHLAVTYDGTAVRLYVNGALVSSKAQTGSMSSTTYPLQIGGDSLYGEYFSGLIDEVRVYNVALTQAQIQADMNTAL